MTEEITLQEIAKRKKAVLKEIKVQQSIIKENAGQLLSPVKTTGRAGAIMQAVGSSMAIIDGVMFGIRTVRRLRRLFGR